jgi:DNA replication protein DnaC
MERIDGLLNSSRKAMSGSSASRKPKEAENALRLGDRICPHCQRELEFEWIEFPPALRRKYGKDGEYYYYPCTPECEQKNDQKEWERSRRDARVKVLQDKSGLSRRLRHYTLHKFDPDINTSTKDALMKAWDYVANWGDNQNAGRGLYFCGDVGTGKTRLAVGVMNQLIEDKGVPSLFVTVPELLDNLRGAYNDPGRNLDEWMEAVKTAELLVMDDLGSEKVTSWVQERLFVIVNHRYQEERPTIFTSNIAPKDLPTQLGERTASRIMSMCEWIALDGEDYRKTEARRTHEG